VSLLGPLADVVRSLDEAGIEHMVVGSVASTHYGPARATQDVDLVIDPDEASLERFLTGVDHERLYVPGAMAREALQDRGQFNVIDYHSSWKIDLMMRGTEPFDIAQFERRRWATIGEVDVFVASPEDTVLAKLRWHRLGGSARQLEDVSGVLEVMAGQLDEAYLDRWAGELGLRELLDEVRSGATGPAR
jgi:hypothetical protein